MVKNTRFIGYARVSTEKQAEKGHSMTEQAKRIRSYCDALDLHLVRTISDAGSSGKTLSRDGWREVQRRLHRGEASGVIVTKLDRLTRSVRDLSEIIDFLGDKFVLLSVSDSIDTRTASGRLVLNVLTSVAQWEREATVERTRATLAFLRSQGKPTGGRPQNPANVSAEPKILALRAKKMPLIEIVKRLNDENCPAPTVHGWRHADVSTVLARYRTREYLRLKREKR